jgi:hypothetical protein
MTLLMLVEGVIDDLRSRICPFDTVLLIRYSVLLKVVSEFVVLHFCTPWHLLFIFFV